MKQSINILLIGIFCLSIIRPVFPYFEYMINFDYITEVLCINKEKTELDCFGKCYLTDALSKVNDKDHPENNRIPNIELEKFEVYYTQGDFTINEFSHSHNCSILTYEIFIQDHSTEPPTPPPEC